MMSPTCIFQGVPPRMCPTLRSCSISPATAAETQPTAATPSAAMMPFGPAMPASTIVSAAMIVVASVRPEIGLLDEPMMPDQVARDGREEEAGDQDDDARQDRGVNRAGEVEVEGDHQQQDRRDADQDDLERQVALGAQRRAPSTRPPSARRRCRAGCRGPGSCASSRACSRRRRACRRRRSAGRWSGRCGRSARPSAPGRPGRRRRRSSTAR